MASGAALVRRISGAVFAAVLLVLSALLFLLVWIVDSPSSPFVALIAIGVLALVFALGAYIGQAFVSRPMMVRAVSWGFLAMGFTVLFVTTAFYPDSAIDSTGRLELGILFVALLAVSLGGIYWRSGHLAAEEHRSAERADWQRRPPASAFDYSAAQAPSVPGAAPPSPSTEKR